MVSALELAESWGGAGEREVSAKSSFELSVLDLGQENVEGQRASGRDRGDGGN